MGNALVRFPSSGGRVLGVHGCVTVHGLSGRRPLRAGAQTRYDRAASRGHTWTSSSQMPAAARCRNRLLISPSKRSVVGVIEEMVKQKLVTLIVPSLVLGSSIPFLFVNQFELTPFARIGRIEGAWIKLHTFGKALDDRETIMVHRPLDHLNHVINLGGVSSRNKGRPGRQ